MNGLDGGEIAGSDSTNPTLANTNVRGFVTAPKVGRSLLKLLCEIPTVDPIVCPVLRTLGNIWELSLEIPRLCNSED